MSKAKQDFVTRKEIIAFIIMNIVLIGTNIVTSIQYRDLLLNTIPEYPFHLWKEIILNSITLFVFSFIVCFALPIYRYIKSRKLHDFISDH